MMIYLVIERIYDRNGAVTSDHTKDAFNDPKDAEAKADRLNRIYGGKAFFVRSYTAEKPRDFMSDADIEQIRRNGWLTTEEADELHTMGPESCRKDVCWWRMVQPKIRGVEGRN